ncbi:hypothetical protein DA456_24275 [Pseudomonas syringae pv. atrofaciens]|uniref:Uncharacterized protein n=1 Tax=Pseudomonas syringae pv. atrofaciens TaxID=192087 RepID=A0AAD0N034_PSESX|nr:hypothetical protein DA456_24275 [Pseudomonas syringae pv. atrofaciens]
MLYASSFLILAGGRRSELVREGACIIAENASIETPSSRTGEASPGSLLRPAGRIKSRLVHNDKRVAWRRS